MNRREHFLTAGVSGARVCFVRPVSGVRNVPKKPIAKKTATKKVVAKKPVTKKPATKKTSPGNTQKAAAPPPASNSPNPFAEAHWPFRRGQEVYYLTSLMKVGGGKVARGSVVHYNPALTGNAVVTKGQPVVTIEPIEGDIGNIATVGVEDVAEWTDAGRRRLEGKIMARLLAAASDYDQRAADCRRQAELYGFHPVQPTAAVSAPKTPKRAAQ